MKKTKRQQEIETAVKPKPGFRWWPWAAGLIALFVVFQVYGPALAGAFVFDDRLLPFMAPDITPAIARFVSPLRPLLGFSFWIDYRLAFEPGKDLNPAVFHSTNVILHWITSLLAALIAARLLSWAGVAGRMRAALAVFCGALFLLHPLQTESVAYVASRSEVLSVMFYYAAFTVFLYRATESITWWRSIAVLALFGSAVAVKEHTLTLPVLFLLTDYFWGRGGIRKNRILYGLLVLGGAAGAVFVARVLRSANTAGFGMRDMTPLDFFYTQCRVLWIYIRLFFLPFGQNVDPDVPVSHNLLEHGAIFGLIALLGLVTAAWIYRKRFPLASYRRVRVSAADRAHVFHRSDQRSAGRAPDVSSDDRAGPGVRGIFAALELFANDRGGRGGAGGMFRAHLPAQRSVVELAFAVDRHRLEIPAQIPPAFSACLRRVRAGGPREAAVPAGGGEL